MKYITILMYKMIIMEKKMKIFTYLILFAMFLLTSFSTLFAQTPNIYENTPLIDSLRENKQYHYVYRPTQNGNVIFRSTSSDESTRHFLAIYEYVQDGNYVQLALSEQPINIITLNVSTDKIYIVYVQPAVIAYWSAQSFNLLVSRPATAPESYFSVTLARDNSSVVITRYVGPRDAGILIIPATIQSLPVSEIARFAFSNENHFNRRTDSFFSDTVYNSGITEIVIPENVRIIGDGAFFMNRMSKVTLPNSLTTIGNSAFDGCSNIREITLPNNVTNYGQNIFQGTRLENITFPSRMTRIPNGLLSGTSIRNINIPEGITEIGDNAFSNCRVLASVTLPSTLRNIGNFSFSGCTALTSISILRGVVSIGNGAFNGCTGLISITIPEGINTINERSFSGCTALQSITLPSTIRNINAEAFANCRNLIEINIPDSVSRITWGGRYSAAVSFFDTTTDTRPFRGIVLPLAVQAKLRQLGYEFHFDS